MKNLLTAILLFTIVYLKSQISFYVPLATTHYQKANNYAINEGGNRGLIASYEKKNVYSLGIIRNSYGYPSGLLSRGHKIKVKKINTILSYGLMSGYFKLYDNTNVFFVPKPVQKIGIIPFLIYSFKVPIYNDISFQGNISHMFVNYGLTIDIK